mgnify:FL=1
MNDTVKEDILSILKKVIDILEVKQAKDVIEIKRLSDHTIHNASIFQGEDSISVAILIYGLSKLVERKQGELDYKRFLGMMQDAASLLMQNDVDKYRETIKKLFKLVSSIDSKLKLYINEVIKQAQIKKGSKIYEHGISLARAAEMLNLSQWELMGYIGKTTLAEIAEKKIDVRARLKLARGLFR